MAEGHGFGFMDVRFTDRFRFTGQVWVMGAHRLSIRY